MAEASAMEDPEIPEKKIEGEWQEEWEEDMPEESP